MTCEHGTPHHLQCKACELRSTRAEVARLRRELSDAEVRLALLVIDQGDRPRGGWWPANARIRAGGFRRSPKRSLFR